MCSSRPMSEENVLAHPRWVNGPQAFELRRRGPTNRTLARFFARPCPRCSRAIRGAGGKLRAMADTAPLATPAPLRGAEPFAYVENRKDLLPGNDVRLLRNGAEAFPAWLEAIHAARER